MSELEDALSNPDELRISFKATYVHLDVDKSGEKPWEHFVWNITLEKDDQLWGFKYRCGIGHCIIPYYNKSNRPKNTWHRQKGTRPTPPSLADVISSVTMHTEGTFEDWCCDFGYDTDSRSALDLYLRCQEEHNNCVRVLGRELYDKLSVLEH